MRINKGATGRHINAHILYRKKGGTQTYKQFEQAAIASLLFDETEENVNNVLLPRNDVLTRLEGTHFPYQVPTNAGGRLLRKKCVVCTKRGYRQDSSYMGVKCVRQTGLCIECFPSYRTKLVYWK